MPIDLAPYDLMLRDWGSSAQLRIATDGHSVSDTTTFPISVIPQTVQLTHTDTLAPVHNAVRGFLVQASSLPAAMNWLGCEIIWRDRLHRIVTADDSGVGGWVHLETIALTTIP